MDRRLPPEPHFCGGSRPMKALAYSLPILGGIVAVLVVRDIRRGHR